VVQAIKQFKEDFSPVQRFCSPVQRFWALSLIAVALGLVAAAERDIQRRPADQVRGSKLLWRLVCLNAVGSAGYFRWGRRCS
jgi:hypothetical protein